jgi:hypothetical protein
MIYTASLTKSSAAQHMSFSQRGLSGLTQDRMSNVTIYGRPDEHQLAYDGYRANIEAFIAATAANKKTTTTADSYPIPLELTTSLPLALPKIVFRLAKKPNAEQLAKLKKGLEDAGLEEMAVGKGDPVFLVNKPSYRDLTKVLPGIALPTAPNVEGYAIWSAIHR